MQTSTESTSAPVSNKSTVDAKILADLAVLKEKMELVRYVVRFHSCVDSFLYSNHPLVSV